MNPRPPHNDAKTNPVQNQNTENYFQGKTYSNVSFKLIANKLFDLKIQVYTYLSNNPAVMIKALSWDLTDVFMSPLTKWHEIIESLQAAKTAEFPVGHALIEELSTSTANITLGKYSHLITILDVRKPN